MQKREAPRDLLVGVFLVVATFAIYGQTVLFEFVNYDDNLYVGDCAQVKDGLTLNGIRWAFTTGRASNWHPITWLSFMVDVQLFGERAGAMHLINVLLHAANSVLLFWVLRRMTDRLWPSAFTAALFAVHPLHVESVAWIAERKDVLSTLFLLLALAVYHAYVRRGGMGRYLGVAALFALGLMTKPMLVTLPAGLMLLDYWPLNRYDAAKPILGQFLKRLLEKTPLFGLAVASAVITFLAQRSGHSVAAVDVLPIPLRIENAILSYGQYVWMLIWPRGLAVFYPHPGLGLSMAQVVVSGVALACITIAAMLLARRCPYGIVGWLWYLGTLIPVIGLVQVGAQAMADRYTYVPYIGLFFAAAWGGGDLAAKVRLPRPALAAAGAVTLLLLTGCAAIQARYWRDSKTLMGHAIEVTSRNYLAHKNLGVALAAEKRHAEAIAEYQKGLKFKPDDADLYYNLGNALGELNRHADAVTQYLKALGISPQHAETLYNLGNALAKQGKFEEAIARYAELLRLRPDHAGGHVNMGNALAMTHRPQEAAAHYLDALRVEPNNEESLANLGNALAEQQRFDEAVGYYRQALQVKPNQPDTLCNMAYSLLQQGKVDEAAAAYNEVLRLDPGNVNARNGLQRIRAATNQGAGAAAPSSPGGT